MVMSRFFVEYFLSRSSEKLCRVTFLCYVGEGFWWPKSLWIRRRGKYQDFSSEIFCLTVPENVVGESHRVSLISGIEKFYTSEGYVTSFYRFFLSHSAEKNSQGNPSVLCFRKIPVAKMFMDKRRI